MTTTTTAPYKGDEVISAIKDYFADLITKEEAIEVIKLYFSS